MRTKNHSENLYAFGMQLVGKTYLPSDYRYGFNGKEKDNDIKNIEGSSYDYGARMYDPRVGRWFSTDPKEDKYPGISTYGYCYDNPILFTDPDGENGRFSINYETGEIHLETTIHLYGKDASQDLANQLNANFAATAPTPRKFIINGKEWTVTISVNYTAVNKEVIDKELKGMGKNDPAKGENSIAQTPNVDVNKLQNFQEGDNIMEVDYSKDWGDYGAAGVSGAAVGKGSGDKSKVHEPFHLLGFDDIPNMGYTKQDVMEGSGDPSVGNFLIGSFHYTDLIEFGTKQSSTSTTIIFNDLNPISIDPNKYGGPEDVSNANHEANQKEDKKPKAEPRTGGNSTPKSKDK